MTRQAETGKPSPNGSRPSWWDKAANLMDKSARLELAQLANVVQHTRREMAQESRRVKAEDEEAHAKLWGRTMPAGEDVGDLFLDKVTIQKRSGGVLPWLMAGLIGASGAGAAGWIAIEAIKAIQSPTATDTDTRNQVGLGKRPWGQ